jgi:DNA repair protein RadC
MLLRVNDNLNALGKLSIAQLTTFKGIGQAKAVTIVAAMELGRRRRESAAVELTKISSSETVFELMQPVIGELSHEEFWIIYLNNANKIIAKSQLSKGGITGTLVDVRLVLRTAIENGAVGLILVHNHPSGTLTPSDADKQITKKLKLAAESLTLKSSTMSLSPKPNILALLMTVFCKNFPIFATVATGGSN